MTIYKSSPLNYNHYFVEVFLSTKIDDVDYIANNFKLDVEYGIDKYELRQNGKVIASPYKLSSKMNKKEIDAKGYASLKYFKNDNDIITAVTRPPAGMPIGCVCIKCNGTGATGHSVLCKSSEPSTDLYINVEGIIYAFDKIKYYTMLMKDPVQLKKKLKANKYKTMINNLTELNKNYDSVLEFINIVDEVLTVRTSTIKTWVKKIIEKADKSMFLDRDRGLTIFKYDMFYAVDDPKPFLGSIIISYVFPNNKRTSVRINSDKKVTFVTVQYVENEAPFFIEFLNKIRKKAVNYIISSSSLSFKIYLEKQSIHVEEINNILEKYSYKMYNELALPCVEYENNGEIFTYSSLFIKRSTVLMIEFNKFRHIKRNRKKYEIGDDIEAEFFETTNETIVVSIYKTGVIQLTYKKNEKNDSEFVNYNDQINNIKNICTQIKNIILYYINKSQSDKLVFKEDKTELKIYPTVSGQMPYANIATPTVGSVIESFNRDTGKWTSKFYIIVKKPNNDNVYSVMSVDNVVKTKIELDEDIKYFDPVEIRKMDLRFLKRMDKEVYLLKMDKDNEIDINFEDFRVLYTKYGDESTIKKGESSVANKNVRPEPYSFYGLCPQSQTAVIDHVGVRSRSDNKYYPVCKILKDSDYKKYKDEVRDYIFNGISEEDKVNGYVEPKLNPVTNTVTEDFYSGTFHHGINDINSEIVYWDANASDWANGTIYEIKNNKSDGLKKVYTIHPLNSDADPSTYPVITGDLFHPMYRESRNFKGINNMPQDVVKNTLISCAIDMNLVEDEIRNLQSRESMFEKLTEVMRRPIRSLKDIVHKTEIMNIDNMKELSEYEYKCINFPRSSIRCVFYVHGNKQRLVSKTGTFKCEIVFTKSNKDDLYIVDGMYSNKHKTFYALNMIYTTTGNDLVELANRTKTLNNTNDNAFINFVFDYGPKEGSTLYKYINENKSDLNEFIFVKREANTNFSYLHVVNRINNPYLTFQILRNVDGKKTWELGLDDRKIQGVYNLQSVGGNLNSKYVRLKLNINNKNGEVYSHDKKLVPYYDITIVDGPDPKETSESLFHKFQTQLTTVRMSFFDSWYMNIYDNEGNIINKDVYSENLESPYRLILDTVVGT